MGITTLPPVLRRGWNILAGSAMLAIFATAGASAAGADWNPQSGAAFAEPQQV